jgi:hypothetical protein
MTSSSLRRWLALSLLGASPAFAALGEHQSSISVDAEHMHARHALERATSQYAVHELKMADGSRVRQYVAGDGRIFAVSWHTLYKPNLSTMLGTSFPAYTEAAHEASQRGGIQRQFRHAKGDLVIQASAHMQVYSGFAYKPSLLPLGLNPQSLGLG